MGTAGTLSPTMTLREFENGYWYAVELREFAIEIGVPGAIKLRKDELERAVVLFLRTGRLAVPTKRALRKTGVKDLEHGLTLNQRIVHYTSNRTTKDFIRAEAKKMAPDVRQKSGCWYRLNRWREAQITSGARLTYGGLIRQFIALNRTEKFEQIRQGRYINFLADFHAAEPEATRADALAAWAALKTMDIPKNYASWAKARGGRKKAVRRSRHA